MGVIKNLHSLCITGRHRFAFDLPWENNKLPPIPQKSGIDFRDTICYNFYYDVRVSFVLTECEV